VHSRTGKSLRPDVPVCGLPDISQVVHYLQPMKTNFPSLRSFMALATVLLASPSLFAANNIWTGVAGATWDVGTTASWTSPTTWVNIDTAIFGATGAGEITTASGVVANGMSVNAAGYSFVGSAPTISGNNLSANGVSVSFGDGATFATGVGVNGSTTGGAVNFTGGNVSLQGAFYFGNANNSTNSVDGTFSGTSTFTHSASNFVVGQNSQADLNYDSTGISTANIMLIGRANGISTFTQTQGTVNITANNSFAVEVTGGNGGSGTLSLQGGSYNLTGAAAAVRVGNTNATSGVGTLSVSGGTLTANAIDLVSSGGGSNVSLTSGTINTNAIMTSGAAAKSIILTGGTIGTSTSTTATWAPNMTLDGNVNFRAANALGAAANITLSGVLSGSGGFTKTGDGSLTFSNSNTFVGPAVVTTGNLATGATGTFGLGNITVANSTSAFLTLANASSIADTATLYFGSDSTIALNFTGTETISALYNQTSGTYMTAGTWTVAGLNEFYGGVDVFTGTGSLQIIPEPSVALLSISALGFAGFIRRRRIW
jgi:hypothetical protein